MPRPGPNKEQEKEDTLFWCGQILTLNPSLSDAEIEYRLKQTDPTGRNFQRWRTGKRAMSADQLQKVLESARTPTKAPPPKNARDPVSPPFPPLLPPNKRSGLILAPEARDRVASGSKERPSELRAKHQEGIRRVDRARRRAVEALQAYAEAYINSGGGALILSERQDGEGYDEIHPNELAKIAAIVEAHRVVDDGFLWGCP